MFKQLNLSNKNTIIVSNLDNNWLHLSGKLQYPVFIVD